MIQTAMRFTIQTTPDHLGRAEEQITACNIAIAVQQSLDEQFQC